MEDKAQKEMRRRINLSYRERKEKIEREYEDKLKNLDDERKSFTRLNLDNLVKRAELVLKEPNKQVPEGYSPLEDVFLQSYGFLECKATGRMTFEDRGLFADEWSERVPEYVYYSTKKGNEFYKKAFGGKQCSD